MAMNLQLRRARLAALLGVQSAVDLRDADGLAITGLRADAPSRAGLEAVLHVSPDRDPIRPDRVRRVQRRRRLGARACPGDLILGKTATAYEVVWRALAGLGAVEAAITMALLDVVGRHAKAPVYQILGGPTRHKIRALTTLEGDTDLDLVAALQRVHAAGFRAAVVPLPATEGPEPDRRVRPGHAAAARDAARRRTGSRLRGRRRRCALAGDLGADRGRDRAVPPALARRALPGGQPPHASGRSPNESSRRSASARPSPTPAPSRTCSAKRPSTCSAPAWHAMA